MNASLKLRPTSPSDEAFLLDLYASTRADEMTATGWGAQQQAMFLRLQFTLRQHGYATQYPAATSEIVERDGVPVGNLILDRQPAEILVVDVAVLPIVRIGDRELRTAGIGRRVVENVLAEGARTGRPVRAHVLNNNRAGKLWQRLGFVSVNNDGVFTRLEWTPPRLEKEKSPAI